MNMIPAGQSPFDSIKHVDDSGEYWLARELMTELGYTGKGNWQNFSGIIDDAKTACASQGYNVEELFSPKTKNPEKSGGRPGVDYRLTRFACYMIALSGEGSKDEVAAAKVYFAVKTREQELLNLAQMLGDDPVVEAMNRIIFREELRDAHKALFDQAQIAGVITHEQHAIFMNWGYKGLYAGETKDDIQHRKELTPRQNISDYMCALEAFANMLRSQIATRNLQEQGTHTALEAGYVHYDAGKEVRSILLHAGQAPEQLPTPVKSYRQIVKDAAARIAEEERQEALDTEYNNGLWGQLPEGRA